MLSITFSDRDSSIRVPSQLSPRRGPHRVQKVSLSRVGRGPEDVQRTLQQDHDRAEDGPGKKME